MINLVFGRGSGDKYLPDAHKTVIEIKKIKRFRIAALLF
ncbi:hypothetical protein NitYY0826_C1372 [Nitratiruptor sp. YY08-26]|nr:hypothetical protein NitYY0813_C1370 [Nitratiruptor sp. YY08-13]BCD66432.1 hypothetical protein NitYY0826_C1372 [Nitratiruptor sp. YY08-26]